MFYQELKNSFLEKADDIQAQQLESYMRNQFEFYGLHTPERRKIYHDFLLHEKEKKQIDWDLLNQVWQNSHREMQYFVCDYLIAMQKYVNYSDINKIEHFVRTKQWWDTIDSLIKPLGYLGLQDERINHLMLTWSTDPDFWIRRVAIEH